MNNRRTATIWVPLAQVRISERRVRSISVSTVERYRQWLEQSREAPPVRLVRQGEGFVVRDGRHRVAAALAAGHAEIKAELHRIAGSGSPATLMAKWCWLRLNRTVVALASTVLAARSTGKSARSRTVVSLDETSGGDRPPLKLFSPLDSAGHSPGDEALSAEHLACTEEERVRLPPSPLGEFIFRGAAA